MTTAMHNAIFDKTDRGREEIATRKYGLTMRLRSLLVIIDGKKNYAELLQKMAGLGFTDECVSELVDQKFIARTDLVAAPTSAKPAAEKIVPVLSESPFPGGVVSMPQTRPVSAATKLFAVKSHFYETIKHAVGLQGFALQIKVERANSLQQCRDLRLVYFEAVSKAKGADTARSMLSRLDQLLDADIVDAEPG